MVDKPIQIQESWECQFLIFPINFLSKLSFNSQFLSKLSPLFYPTKIFQTKVLEEHNLELKNVPFKWKIFSLKKPTHYPVLFSILSQLGKNFIVDFHVSIDHGLVTAGLKSQGSFRPKKQISCYCPLVSQSQDWLAHPTPTQNFYQDNFLNQTGCQMFKLFWLSHCELNQWNFLPTGHLIFVVYRFQGVFISGWACLNHAYPTPDSWGCKESDTTEQLNWTELNWSHPYPVGKFGMEECYKNIFRKDGRVLWKPHIF